MDDYFEKVYTEWLQHNFLIPMIYEEMKISHTPYFDYYEPVRWWKYQAPPIKTKLYQIINLEDYYIE